MTAATTSDCSRDGFKDVASMVSTTSVMTSVSAQTIIDVKIDEKKIGVLPVEASLISSLASASR